VVPEELEIIRKETVRLGVVALVVVVELLALFPQPQMLGVIMAVAVAVPTQAIDLDMVLLVL
jgi:hypothetical protein